MPPVERDQVGLRLTSLNTFTEIKTPFPELTFLELVSNDENPPVIYDLFLGESASCLTIGKLLVSTTDLSHLHLSDIFFWSRSRPLPCHMPNNLLHVVCRMTYFKSSSLEVVYPQKST